MKIKAVARKGYIYKFLMIGLCAVVFGGWHLNDAIFNYPGLREHADKYLEMRGPLNENGEANISDGDLQDAWKQYAEPRGMPITEPKLHDEIDNLIIYNYFIGIVFGLVGLWCLFNGLPTIGKWIQLDDGIVSTKGGSEIAISDVTEIDKKRWEKKGLTKVTSSTNGKVKSIWIDDIKFERGPTDQIMAEIERVAGEDKIVNGKPESEYEKIRQQKVEEEAERAKAMNEMDGD